MEGNRYFSAKFTVIFKKKKHCLFFFSERRNKIPEFPPVVSADSVTFLSFLQSLKNREAIKWRIWKKLKKFHAWRYSIPILWGSRVKINSHSRQLRNEIAGIQEIEERDKWIGLIYFQYQRWSKIQCLYRYTAIHSVFLLFILESVQSNIEIVQNKT